MVDVNHAYESRMAERRIEPMEVDAPIHEAPASVEPVGGVSYAVYESAVKGRQDFRAAYKAQRDLLSAKEWQVVEQIGRDAELSISAVLRQSVRLYQLHCDRLKAGETFSWSGDEQRLKDFAGPLYTRPEPDTIGNEIAKILQDDPICGGRVSGEAIGRISNMLVCRDV